MADALRFTCRISKAIGTTRFFKFIWVKLRDVACWASLFLRSSELISKLFHRQTDRQTDRRDSITLLFKIHFDLVNSLLSNGYQGLFTWGQSGRSVKLATLSSAEVNNAWSCTSAPQYAFMAWCLDKHRDNFYSKVDLYLCLTKYHAMKMHPLID
jgi:hypothetical protein